MKKIILLVLLSIYFQVSNAQTSNWLWAESSDGGSYEYGFGLFVDTGGHLFTSGRLSSSGTFGSLPYNLNGNTSPYVEKFDTSGSGVWINGTAFTGFDYSEGFGVDNKDNSYVTGIEGSSLPIAKFNKAGNTVWAKTFSGTTLSGQGIAADNEGYIYIVGVMNQGSFTMGSITFTYPGSANGIFLAKLDSNGNCIWGKTIYGTGSADGTDQGEDIVVDNKGYIYFIGYYNGSPLFGTLPTPASTGGVSNFFVAKYDTAGNAVWVTTSTNSFGSDFGGSVGLALDSCDNIYTTGIFENTAQFGPFSRTSMGGEDAFVAKLNSSGQWQWVSAIGSSGRDAGFSICTDKHNEVFVGGDYGGTANLGNGVTLTGAGGGFVAKYANSTGQALWALGGLGSTAGHIYGMAVDRSGYAYALGDFSGSVTFGTHTVNCTNGTSNIFLAKLDTVAPRQIIPTINTSYCPGETATIPYSIVGSFNNGNTFTAQLSDSTGSFINATTIGSISSSTAGTITITIPLNTKAGSNYLIRVVSSNPGASSYVNGCGAYYNQNVYPNDFYVTIASGLANTSITPSDSTTICLGSSVLLTASAGQNYTYTWSNNATTDTTTVNPVTTTTYIVTISNGACSANDTVKVKVNAVLPLTIFPPSPQSACAGQGVTLSVPVSGSGYTWSASATLSPSTGDTVVATPTVTTTYSVTGTDSVGCTVTATDSISVFIAPQLIIQPQGPQSVCPGQSIALSVPVSGKNYQWLPSATLKPDTGDTVLAYPLVQTTYTVSGIDSLGCLATSDSEVVSVSNAPNKPTITVLTGNVLQSSATQGNQWVRNDSILTGAMGENYTATIPGWYQVIAENPANGCSTTSDSVDVTDSSAGVNRLSAISNQLSIYPNPTGGEIFININSSAGELKDWTMEITDVLGRTVYTQLSLNYSNAIDLSKLASGMYFICVMNKTARAVVPVVKQN